MGIGDREWRSGYEGGDGPDPEMGGSDGLERWGNERILVQSTRDDLVQSRCSFHSRYHFSNMCPC